MRRLKKFELIGRSEQIDETNGISSSYACQNCCYKTASGMILSGGITEAEVGDQIQFTAYEQGTDCYSNTYGPSQYITNEIAWSISDNNIATINEQGLLTVVGVGDVQIGAYWKVEVTSTQGGYCPVLLTEQANVSAEGNQPDRPNLLPDCEACFTENAITGSLVGINAKPKVTNVTADGTTRITQIVGNQNIIHFVTPKGATNGQVT